MKYTFVLYIAAFVAAQENVPLTFCIDEAVVIALNNHPVASKIDFAERKDVLLQQQSLELEPVQLRYWRSGASAGTHTLFSATQNFGSILEHVRRAQHHRAAISAQQAARTLTVEELAWKVKAAYTDVVYYNQRLEIMLEHAPLFEALIYVAEARMTADSISDLERVSTGARYAAFISRMYIAQEEAKRAELRLRQIMNLPDEEIKISQTTLGLYQIHPDKPVNERFNPVKHNAFDDAMLSEAQAAVNLEKSRMYPAIHAGYVYQNIEGAGRFQGWMAGMSLPVWVQPQRARIKQAQTDLKIKEMETKYRQFSDNVHVETLKSLLNDYFLLISFSRENLLVEAGLIVDEVEKNFLAGRITDFAGAFTKLGDAVNSHLNYLEYMSLYNQTALELEFFTQ